MIGQSVAARSSLPMFFLFLYNWLYRGPFQRAVAAPSVAKSHNPSHCQPSLSMAVSLPLLFPPCLSQLECC